jgi:hypothetical protein
MVPRTLADLRLADNLSHLNHFVDGHTEQSGPTPTVGE